MAFPINCPWEIVTLQTKIDYSICELLHFWMVTQKFLQLSEI